MLNILITTLFLWLFFKAIGLVIKAAFSTVKVTAIIMIVIAGIAMVLAIMFSVTALLLASAVIITMVLLLLRTTA